MRVARRRSIPRTRPDGHWPTPHPLSPNRRVSHRTTPQTANRNRADHPQGAPSCPTDHTICSHRTSAYAQLRAPLPRNGFAATPRTRDSEHGTPTFPHRDSTFGTASRPLRGTGFSERSARDFVRVGNSHRLTATDVNLLDTAPCPAPRFILHTNDDQLRTPGNASDATHGSQRKANNHRHDSWRTPAHATYPHDERRCGHLRSRTTRTGEAAAPNVPRSGEYQTRSLRVPPG